MLKVTLPDINNPGKNMLTQVRNVQKTNIPALQFYDKRTLLIGNTVENTLLLNLFGHCLFHALITIRLQESVKKSKLN